MNEQKNKFETLSMVKDNRFSIYIQDHPYLALSMSFLQESFLNSLIGVFEDGGAWTEVVKKHLLNPDSRGITGELTEIKIDNNKVFIAPIIYNSEEDYDYADYTQAIEIGRQELLNIINAWEELADKKCQRITFTRHEDGSITLAGQ